MSNITDLTGTSWYLPAELVSTGSLLTLYFEGQVQNPSDKKLYNFHSMYIYDSGLIVFYNSSQPIQKTIDDSTYLTITGGTDVANPTAISWFEIYGKQILSVPVKEETPTQSNIVQDGMYGLECGAYNAIHQLHDVGSNGGEYRITLYNLNLTSAQTALYFSLAASEPKITLIGDNIIDTSRSYENNSNTSQRGISSSSTVGSYLTGDGESTLTIYTSPYAKKAPVKGNWIIQDAKVSVIIDETKGTAINSTYDMVEVVTGSSIPQGITLRGSGTFSINGRKVVLKPSENGYIDVNIKDAVEGTKFSFTSHPDPGYAWKRTKVGGTIYNSTSVSVLMPGANGEEGLVIQAIFEEGEEPEPDDPSKPNYPDLPEATQYAEFSSTAVYEPKNGDVFVEEVEDHQINIAKYTGSSLKEWKLFFDNFNLEHNSTPIIFGDGNDVTITLIGSNSSSAKNTTGQRGMSSSATTPVKLIGYGEGASLTLNSVGTNETLKGCYHITNADIIVNHNPESGDPISKVNLVSDGVSIIGNGSFSINGAKVVLKSRNNGKLKVSLKDAQPGTTVEITVIEGNIEHVFYNDSAELKSNDGIYTFTMPKTSETVKISGIFESNEPEEPELTSQGEIWYKGVLLATLTEGQTVVLHTEGFKVIEDIMIKNISEVD